ncbi:cytochrome P450 [Sphingomonas sp. C8-2]|nr:cytochrome P450 [Sphingomonas sp. C8-2]
MKLHSPDLPRVIWTFRNGGHWIATNADTVTEAFRNPDRFTSKVIILPREAGEKYDFIPTRLDPPGHTPYRALVNTILELKRIRRLEGQVRQIAIDLIEPLVAQGRCNFTTDYADEFPIRVFMAIVDLPMADAPLLVRYANQMVRPDGATADEKAASVEASIQGFYRYLDPIVNERRANGPDKDVIAAVARSEINGKPLPHSEALNIIANLLLAGLDTVASFLNFIMIFMSRNPEHVKQLVEDPEIIPRAVEELVRRFPVVADSRTIGHDMEFDGVTLKAGDMIMIPTAFKGLDGERNKDPWTVDFFRQRPEHNTFGDGHHRCAGMHLARMEIMITLQEWLKRIPTFHMKPGAVPQYCSGTAATVRNVPIEWR